MSQQYADAQLMWWCHLRSNVELAEHLHKSEIKLSEVSEEVENSTATLEKEQQRCAELEETLCSSTLARQLDLRDIWRLVQKDVERECQDTQDENITTSSAEQLKEKIKSDITALRTRLQKREAALGALKKSNLNLPLLRSYDDGYLKGNWSFAPKLSPSSPLVDALTIDVLNGNFPMNHPKYSYLPSVVSCEDVDCNECRAARLSLRTRYTTSCPTITPSPNNNSQQLSSLESEDSNYIQATHSSPGVSRTVETTTDSDCSVTNSTKRQRSLYGSQKRQDFIRRSGKFMDDKTVIPSNKDQFICEETRKSTKNTRHNNNHNENSFSSSNIYQFAPNEENNCFTKDSTATLYSNDTNHIEPPIGVRRPSFTYAVQQNQRDHAKLPNLTHDCETHRDLFSFTEELRRPSFHAAIEHGKDNIAGLRPSGNIKDINNTLSGKKPLSPSKSGLLSSSKKFKNEKNETYAVRTEPSKTVKFNLEEDESDLYGGVYTGALAWGAADQKTDFRTIASVSFASSFSSTISSTAASSSSGSSTSSLSAPGDISRSISLGSRSWSSQDKKLQILLEDPQQRLESKPVEDWDMSPNNNVLSYSFGHLGHERCDAFIDNSVDDRKEAEEQCTDVSASEHAHAAGDMPVSMNNNSHTRKEVIRSQSNQDGPIPSIPDRCARRQQQESKPASPARGSSGSQPSQGSRRGHAATTTTASSTSLAPLSPPASTAPPSSQTHAHTSRSTGQTGKDSEVKDNSSKSIHRMGKSNQSDAQHSENSPSTEVETPRLKETVVPASPPTTRNNLSVTQQAQPLGPSRLSQIRQNHLASKKREQMKARSMKLPELSENSELETPPTFPGSASANGPINLENSSSPNKIMPQISVTNVDAEVPPVASDDPVTPSLPDSFLKKLGLAVKGPNNADDNDVNVDQLPEKDVESKFISLSLAFKTDKLTLDQRVSVQERARDLAEQNVDTELQGLRDAVDTLNELVSDEQVRNVLQKIKQHIDVLEQSAARVSSRAEVFGAVQQERRMCKAMEVMVLYTENLRRVREREESELQEARKILSERSGNGFSLDADSGPARRSMSVGGFGAGGRPMRRRSEVALPRVLGGIGSPSLTQTSSLESSPSFLERSNFSAHSQDSEEGEDPKSRFQSAVASTSMQHVVTNTMRRASLEKQRSLSVSSSTSLSPTSAPATPFLRKISPATLSVTKEVGDESIPETSGGDKTDGGKKITQDEEAFRKGFEEGLKTKLSQELNDLREQQNSISHNLEQVMDKVDQSQLEDDEYLSRPSRLESAMTLASKVGGHIVQYDWRSNKKVIRNIAGVFLVFLAVLIVFLSPPISTVDVRHFPKPPQ